MDTRSKEFLDRAKESSVEEIGELIWEMDKDNYEERPVDINTFIDDPTFLGDIWEEDFYPFWREELNKLYPSAFYSPYYEAIADLPIGSGKTTVSNVSICYDMYRVHCLHDPHDYFNIRPRTVPIVFAILSAAKMLAEDVNWASLEGMFEASVWFREKCPLNPDPERRVDDKDKMIKFPKNTGIVLGSSARHVIGKAVFGGSLDEANYQHVKSTQAKQSYLAILRRMESRFLKMGGVIPGMLWLLSSPRFSTDFLATHVESQAKSPRTFIIYNAPIWNIVKGTSKDIYSGDTFRVFVGDKNRDPFIAEPGAEVQGSNIDPRDIVDVPIEHYQSFLSNPIEAIQDIIGRETASSINLFRIKSIVVACCSIKHKFSKEIVEMDFWDETDTLINYADLEYFKKPMYPNQLRFLHADLSVKNDKTGLASTFAVPTTRVFHQEANYETMKMDQKKITEREFITDWVLTIKAKQGQEIHLRRIELFLVFLIKIGYPIYQVSFDQAFSRGMRQELTLQGIKNEYISVDATREPYLAWKQALESSRWIGPRSGLLVNEALTLRDDGKKVDHPLNGSKDTSDAVAGSFWACLNSKVVTRMSGAFEEQPAVVANPLQQALIDGMRQKQLREAYSSFFA